MIFYILYKIYMYTIYKYLYNKGLRCLLVCNTCYIHFVLYNSMSITELVSL